MTKVELEEFAVPVALPDAFTGGLLHVADPRGEYDKCEARWRKYGRGGSLSHAMNCVHCRRLVGVCHEAALETDLVIQISRLDAPLEEESHGFAIVG